MAYQRSAALKGAIEIDLFTAIGSGASSPAGIAEKCRASERGVRILCDYLVVVGLLLKENGRYRLTQDSAVFLDRRSPAYIGEATRFVNSKEHMENFNDLAGVVRNGGTLRHEGGALAPEDPLWVEFARSMGPLMRPAADWIAAHIGPPSGRELRVLDIAAGHGLFGITIARQHEGARITAIDWSNVLQLATENARKAGVADRYSTLPGSAFEVEFGTGYDIVLLTNFLHHFNIATCERLLRKVHSALNPDGTAITLEFVPNEDRVSPPVAAMFSMTMLGNTPAGDAYTFSELEQMFRNAGFRESELHPVTPTPESVITSRK